MTNQIVSLMSAPAGVYSSSETHELAAPGISIAQQETTEEMFRIANRLQLAIKPSETLIACTGVVGGDPSGSFATHLALALARLGRQPILLVDGHFRKENTAQGSGKDRPGFADLLSNDCSADTAIQFTDVDGLSILTAGNIASLVPSQLFSDRLNTLLDSFRRYRLVIMDVGPLSENSQSLLLASKADALVAVASSGDRTKRQIARLKTEMDLLKARFLGLVLTELR